MNLKASPSRRIWPASKCPPMTSTGRSAKRENSVAPGFRRLSGIGIGGRGPIEMGHLAGVVGDVAGQQTLFAVRADMKADMAWAMAGRRDQGDLFTNAGVAGDEIGLAGRDDRRHGILERSPPCPAPCCGRASRRIRPSRTRNAPSRRSAPIGHPQAAYSSRRDRRGDACTARCRCSPRESRPP